MNPNLKKKLQPSIDAFLPIGEKEKLIYLSIELTKQIFGEFLHQKRISHQTRCAKLGRLLALQTDRYMKYIIYNKFKRT